MIQLPSRIDANEAELPTWDEDVSSIQSLLTTRTTLVGANWYSATSKTLVGTLGQHPHVFKMAKELRGIGQVLIDRESANQAQFIQAIRTKYDKELLQAEASSGWDSPRRIKKLNTNWAGSGLEGLPV